MHRSDGKDNRPVDGFVVVNSHVSEAYCRVTKIKPHKKLTFIINDQPNHREDEEVQSDPEPGRA